MSESKRWRKIGEEMGRDIAKGLESGGLGDAVRALFVLVFGQCRVCERPLGGHSPEQICVTCHAAEVMRKATGAGATGGDA